MQAIKGYHGEWNMGSPGGWEYQRISQLLGKMAWGIIEDNIEVGVNVNFDHPQINAVPGFAKAILKVHKNRHGRNPVNAVLLAETETLDVVLENKNFVNYLNSIDGVNASLSSPGHLSVKNGKVLCRDKEATTIFMDFNSDTLLKMAKNENIEPIKEAVKQGILINLGMENAKKEVLNTKFVQGDARDTGLPDKYFWVIIIMGNSFGYFLDECENTNILHEVFRLLMQNGSLFLDLPNKEYVLRNFNPQSWHEANEDIVVCRQRKFENDIIFSRELVVSKKDGLMRDINYYTRIYGEKQISEVLSSTGFSSVTIKKDFVSHEKNGDYGCMTNRMIVTAHKK